MGMLVGGVGLRGCYSTSPPNISCLSTLLTTGTTILTSLYLCLTKGTGVLRQNGHWYCDDTWYVGQMS